MEAGACVDIACLPEEVAFVSESSTRLGGVVAWLGTAWSINHLEEDVLEAGDGDGERQGKLRTKCPMYQQ
ncbi:hypothetical protein E2562_019658 [Oryza meyeriana var. granulata]|uniref:Uncharacterized protein n=1 Tax=Oryza meyeriana var. granulata TaxID=110450 RepID=A0A6G1C698_9ORYZ|nr:hypothetical protein E2562_019658 [Oryza meyeriana var. granulata]